MIIVIKINKSIVVVPSKYLKMLNSYITKNDYNNSFSKEI